MSDSGLIEIALVAFDLKSKSKLTQVWFFKFSSNSIELTFCRSGRRAH